MLRCVHLLLFFRIFSKFYFDEISIDPLSWSEEMVKKLLLDWKPMYITQQRTDTEVWAPKLRWKSPVEVPKFGKINLGEFFYQLESRSLEYTGALCSKFSFLADRVEKAADSNKDCSKYDIYIISRISNVH